MSTITTTGTVYIRQPVSDIEYSTNNVDWFTLSFPVTFINNNTSSTLLVVDFTTDLVLTSNTQYFMCGSDFIQFGNRTLRPDGKGATINMNGISNYPGLINNGSIIANGYNSIYVVNLTIAPDISSSTLALAGGWIGQSYYSKGAVNNKIINCNSGLDISVAGGGIVGEKAATEGGNLFIIGCSSSGLIEADSGGIVGIDAGDISGTVRVESSATFGPIGIGGGGIFGSNAAYNSGVALAVKCYSTGSIGEGAGGIFGRFAGGVISAENCYSIGPISSNGGGIVGSGAGSGGFVQFVSVSNCYSTGTIGSTNAGGIIGDSYANQNVTNCYTCGTRIGTSGGIFAGQSSDNPNFENNYSEGNNDNTGSWVSSNTFGILQGINSDNWMEIIVNTAYDITPFGVSPYTLTTIKEDYTLQQSFSESVEAGSSTTSGRGNNFLLIGAPPGVTIDNNTGVITTPNDLIGEYTFLVRTEIYSITTFVLTITEAPIPPQPPTPPIVKPTASTANDSSSYIATRSAQIISAVKNSLDPNKARAPSPYSFYSPYYRFNAK